MNEFDGGMPAGSIETVNGRNGFRERVTDGKRSAGLQGVPLQFFELR